MEESHRYQEKGSTRNDLASRMEDCGGCDSSKRGDKSDCKRQDDTQEAPRPSIHPDILTQLVASRDPTRSFTENPCRLNRSMQLGRPHWH